MERNGLLLGPSQGRSLYRHFLCLPESHWSWHSPLSHQQTDLLQFPGRLAGRGWPGASSSPPCRAAPPATEGTSTSWLRRQWEQDGSDQGQAFCPRVPSQLALPAIPHSDCQPESKAGAPLPASAFLTHCCLFGPSVLLIK